MAEESYSRAACFISAVFSAAYVLVNGARWWWILVFLFIGLLVFMHDRGTTQNEK